MHNAGSKKSLQNPFERDFTKLRALKCTVCNVNGLQVRVIW